MFKWLKERAEKASANQVRSSIALDARRLVDVSNQIDERIHRTGEADSFDIERVCAAQQRLLDDIALGLANRLSLQDIEGVISGAFPVHTVSEGAGMALNHVLKHVRTEIKKAG